MPFGPNCEYADFAECVRKNRDRDNPEGYCAAIQKRTEGHCNMAAKLKIARPVARLKQGRADWYRIENKDRNNAEIWIYDEIGYFGVTAQDFVKELHDVDAANIDLHLNSPGGDVFNGIAIYTALKEHKARVTTKIDSLAASIASVIAMSGDEITVAKNGTMMIHDGHGLTVGNAADMREMADLLDKTSDNIASIYAERAGGETADWREKMRAETWYNAEEAKAAGLVDEIRGEAKDGDTKNAWDLSIYSYAGREHAPAPAVAAKLEPAFAYDAEEFRRVLQEVFGA